MKFGDITKSILIILLFVILFFSTFFIMGLKDIKENWPKYRCSPLYMPLAGSLGYDAAENFSYCVGNIQSGMMGFFLEPIQYILGMGVELFNEITGSLNFIRTFISEIRNRAKAIIGDIYGIFINVIIQFQKLIIKLKDTMMKLVGVITTFVYLIQSARLTGNSIKDGPIGQTLEYLCFSKNTKIKLQNGKIKNMKDIYLGDVLENGTEVCGTLKLKGGSKNPYYKIWSDKLQEYIYVTGSHKIFKHDGSDKNLLNNYIDVKDFPKSIKTGAYDNMLYCLITNNHQIPIGEYTFWDWED